MPTQIQGLVTPVYEPIITVPATSETITEAGLTDTALALANRIEFVRNNTDAGEAPELRNIVREDWHGAIWDSVGNILYGEFPWRTSVLGSPPSVAHEGGTAKNPGKLKLQLPSDCRFGFGIGAQADSPFGAITTDQIVLVAMVDDDPGNVVTNFLLGLLEDWDAPNGGTNAIALSYSKVFPNWRIYVRRASGTAALIDTGVPIVAGEFVTCRFKWVSPGPDIEVYLDGTLVTTVDTLDRPTGELNLGGCFQSTVADAGVFAIDIDFIHATGNGPSPSRSGPG